MARISTYNNDTNLSPNDKVIGSDSNSSNGTKNFTLAKLLEWIEDNTELDIVNIGDGIGIYSSRVDNDFQFKTLLAGDDIELIETATGIEIRYDGISGGTWGQIIGTLSDQIDLQNALDAKQGSVDVAANTGLDLSVSDELSTTYNSTIADNVQSVAVGGISAGTPASQLKSLNVVQVLDTLIFPTVLPSIGTNKSVSLSVSGGGGTLEIGATISRQLTADFIRGTIINGDGTTNSNPLVGAATQYTFSGTGISPSSQASNVLNIGPSVVVSGSNNWSVLVNHDAGTGDYFDNKGNPASNLDASRVSGTVSDNSSSPSITGVHPYFYLKSASPITASSMATAIANGTATKVVASSTGTLNIPYNVSSQYLAVAYPSTSTTKTVYYVTALDNGAITVVFNAVVTQSVNSPDGYWSGVNYKIHTSKSALTNSNPTIQLRNS